MSLTELMAYAARRRIRVGIVTNARGREETVRPAMIAIEARTPAGEFGAVIAAPRGFAELERAAGELLAELRSYEDDGA
jgi:hypothetical protein